ncbi:hypothetical protein FRC06_008005 [Ceratobasidium sp. 370]|nr:hypothetical protein FRC06_008005 [Ceratobasidium sp. 370]
MAPLPPSDTTSSDSGSIRSTEDNEDVCNDCWKLLYYLAVYTILVLPLSVVRWMTFTNPSFADPPLPSMTSLATAQMTFHALYRLSGVINVALVLGTRPEVLLLGERGRSGNGEEDHPYSVKEEKSAGDAGLLNQRANATQPVEQVKKDSTGFGGLAVNLSRGED